MDHKLIFQTANVTETYPVRHEHDGWKSGDKFEYTCKYNWVKKIFGFLPITDVFSTENISVIMYLHLTKSTNHSQSW